MYTSYATNMVGVAPASPSSSVDTSHKLPNQSSAPHSQTGNSKESFARMIARQNKSEAHEHNDPINAFEYLSSKERAKRSEDKCREAVERKLTPDWFVESGLCVPKGIRVGIIGGGFAGLYAAWYLEKCGVKTIIYEANDRTGGRVRSNHKFVPGKTIEDGAELIGENHALWNILAQEHKLKLEPLTDYETVNLKHRTRFADKDLTTEEETMMNRGLVKYFAIIGSIACEVDEVSPWLSPIANVADAISVADMLDILEEKLGKEEPGSDEIKKELSLARHWLNFTLTNDNCADVSEQSALGLLASVSAARMGSDEKGMMGYWLSSETHRCAGGNDQLATRLDQDLSDLRLSTVVEKVNIVPSNQGAVQIISRKKHDAQRKPLEKRNNDVDYVDYVLLATASSVWDAIDVTPPHIHASRALQQGSAVKYMSRYNSRSWEDTGLAPTATSDELGAVWEATDNQGSEGPFTLTAFSGGSNVRKASDYAGELAKLHPPQGIPTDQQLVDWSKEEYIKTGYSVKAVGQVTSICPNQIVPHAGRMHIIGEETEVLNGFMEGALRSAGRGSRNIMENILKAVGAIHPS
jgi:monoamine oxidase